MENQEVKDGFGKQYSIEEFKAKVAMCDKIQFHPKENGLCFFSCGGKQGIVAHGQKPGKDEAIIVESFSASRVSEDNPRGLGYVLCKKNHGATDGDDW